jgi:hypothetical protein
MRIDKESQLIAIQLFSSESFLAINKRLLKMFGPNLTIFICNLVDKYKYFLSHGMIGRDGSFFLTFENQSEDTGMTKCELRACKRKLIEMRVLKTLMKSVPAKEFYFINIEILLEKFLTPRDKDSLPLEIRKVDRLRLENLTTIKDSKIKENKLKENKFDICQKISPENIISLWNKLAKENDLPSVSKLPDSRKDKILSRCKSIDLSRIEDWKELFEIIPNCPFLLGESDSGWKVNFDWIVRNDKNYLRILEGEFTKKKKTQQKRIGTAKPQEGKYKNILRTVVNSDTGRVVKMRGEEIVEVISEGRE